MISMKGLAIILNLVSLHLIQEIYAVELDTISDSQFLTDGDTLVSVAGNFELGFFRPGNPENRYLGIWYKKISVQTVIWVANRDHPLVGASSHVLKIVGTGSLVLFNNARDVVWSSNTTSSRNATAKLLDNGNLVVTDDTPEKVLWQSFDHLTDSLIPGMKFGRDLVMGKEWFLSSWKSNQDPAPGEFSYILDTDNYPQNLVKQGKVIKSRGPWNGQRYSRESTFGISVNFTYNYDKAVAYTYIENSSGIMRVTLNSSGQLERLAWIENDRKWHVILAIPKDLCDAYNLCNAYASCSMTSQTCACLDETRFVPRNQKGWEIADWTGGCVRRTPLDCKSGPDGFIKYSNVKLPDAKSSWFNRSMTRKECEAKCFKNCSCMGYANTDVSFDGRGCLLWFDDLVDIKEISKSAGGQDIFVRMASSELVAEKKRGSLVKIILLVLILGILILGLISTWFCCARIKRFHGKPMGEGEVLNDVKQDAMELPLFSFSTIGNATANFSPDYKLGEGGFGQVYKGLLEEGLEIAVKRLSETSRQGVDEFKNEVICISKLQHRNLVKLLGCCLHGDEKLLIYEFMPNGSLDSFIFDKTRSMLLDWTKRFDIIKGIARGLLYLHEDSRLRIIHRDLKASNILLDLHMNPKISDFGLARTFGGNESEAKTRRVVGTYGYMSPEYALDGVFSTKSDVFSFGVLVLEIVSGKRNRGFIHREHDNLIGYAWSVYNEGRSMELVDAGLAESCHPSEVLRSIGVGLLCVQQDPGDRPHMSSVIQLLAGEGALPQPKLSTFFMGKESFAVEFSSSTYAASSINDLTITGVDAR